MLGRVSYYIKKGYVELGQKGFQKTLINGFEFLIRRKFFLQFLFESLEYRLWSRFRSVEDTLIQVLHQDLSRLQSNRLMIYVSYDSQSEIRDHVRQQLQAFSQLGYEIIFVTTSSEVGPAQVQELSQFCALIVHRKNEGYDFCSWKLGHQLASGWAQKAKSVILMNDSCLGPYFDLRPSVEKMEQSKNTVFGITKSYEITEYIQSYFFHFSGDLIQNGLMDRFFDRIRILRSKWAIVRFLEIGSSRFFKQSGIRLQALVEPKESEVKALMDKAGKTEPCGDPVGSWLVERKINPFYKRSNQAAVTSTESFG